MALNQALSHHIIGTACNHVGSVGFTSRSIITEMGRWQEKMFYTSCYAFFSILANLETRCGITCVVIEQCILLWILE